MAIIKCKMCGGDLEIIPDSSVAQCEYCGSRQTVPKADDQKKLTLFARAGRLRSACEFDKAAGIYESIVADFPEEAEAYWGLVLCKYGIEYVDDPATAKKIPTCHRSSFDSLMDDGDFEQTLENCDSVARKVYREEAKQIEELRKGIIAVSSNEQPYDLFICYKETDENGERTLDSVLAQDVYDALTDKGYRVFFSRITLEDKLGQEYEPYIFAALNSAKIMLAFGTDYEYFNAVWVKNEWSRYLKLMAKDKEKHLIPCFKGIDAYDMPKEFAKLQAQDLGKIGAMQDLLRGIEKLLPRKSAAAVQIAAGSDNKILSLLERGFLALEDGDWTKADNFFEDTLNNESKNASAYLGKTLAQEQCRSLDDLVRKRRDATQNASPVTLFLQPKQEHIERMVQKCCQFGCAEQEQIQKLYQYDLSYPSEVAQRKEQYRSQEAFWNSHRWLSRAQKFATAAEAEKLTAARNALFTTLERRVKQAEEAENIAKDSLQQAYDAHLARADARAAELHENGMERLEARYQDALRDSKDTKDVRQLKNAANAFDDMEGYKDSKELAADCRKRADEEQAALIMQRRQEEAERYKEAERIARKKRWIFAGAAAAVVVVISLYLLLTRVWIPDGKYEDANALMASGQYREALSIYESLDGYKDSADRMRICQYRIATALMEEKQYREALPLLAVLDDYRNSKDYYAAALRQITVQQTIGVGRYHTVALHADGTVAAIGDNGVEQCNVSDWTDIVSISAGGEHTVGLRSDGTVVAVGEYRYGQCYLDDWTDIVAISAGNQHTVGLRSDGTVVANGYNDDGQCNVSSWTDIIAISAGQSHTLGLCADGTVVAVGYNRARQCNVSDWTDIVAISAGNQHSVGLRADGTVVAVGNDMDGQCDVSGWTDIVAISAGDNYTLGLRADGTVVATGVNGYGQFEMPYRTDYVAICAGDYHTVGLRADGTVVAVGYNQDRQCLVSYWKNIKIPQTMADLMQTQTED